MPEGAEGFQYSDDYDLESKTTSLTRPQIIYFTL